MVVASYADRSGIIQGFGPYDTEEEAELAKAQLPLLPALSVTGGLWEVVLCSDLVSEGWS